MDGSQTLERQQLLERELERYVRLLIAKADPERVILFGSLASGEIGPWSDIDLVIVRRTDLPFWQRMREMRLLLRPQVGTDILVYTPEENERLSRERAFFQQEIVAEGRVLYERGTGGGHRA